MGFIGSLFSGSNGAGFKAQGTNIQTPINTDQVNGAYNNTQSALGQQQSFVNALGGVNGIGNQQSVFNQLQGVANGTGPNPAATMLNNATGANNAATASLMAGNRGAGANAGLVAREAGQQGAANQQNAIGQAANMQANQSLNAMGQMGTIAGNQVNQQQQGLADFNQNAINGQSNLISGMGNQNNAQVGMQSNINTTNGAIAQGNQKFQQGVLGSVAGGIGSVLGLADGGQVPSSPAAGPQSTVGKFFKGVQSTPIISQGANAPQDPSQKAGEEFGSGIDTLLKGARQGVGSLFASSAPMGTMPMGSGATDLPMAPMGQLFASQGATVPGKASVAGDSKKNDTVPAMLSPGEIVIPRSHSNDPDKAAAFARAVVMKNKKGKK